MSIGILIKMSDRRQCNLFRLHIRVFESLVDKIQAEIELDTIKSHDLLRRKASFKDLFSYHEAYNSDILYSKMQKSIHLFKNPKMHTCIFF